MINANLSLSPEIIDVFLGDFEAIKTENIDLLKTLDKDETERFYRFSNEKAKRHFLVARSYLKVILGKYLGQLPETLTFAKGIKGKPYLQSTNTCTPLFNLSHSQDRFIISVSTSITGVDIEFLKKKIAIESILNRFFSEKERQSFYENCESKDDVSVFLRGWTRKEAILKATGEGVAGLAKVSVSFSPDDENALLEILTSEQDYQKDWKLKTVKVGSDYTASISYAGIAKDFRLFNISSL